MSYNESKEQVQTNTFSPAPRLRVNNTTGFTLSTTWQRVTFTGTSTYNINTFPTITGNTNPQVWYDTTNNVFKFSSSVDQNYDIAFNAKISSANVLSLASISVASVRMRFVVPAPTPIYFPFPDGDQYLDFDIAGMISVSHRSYGSVLYANSSIRQYGVGIELCMSAALSSITLNAADAIIYGR